ncbi:MAG: hypothetical protein P0Y50_10235 [Candidatus Brevundimonas colombiensis]|uniref:Uncharacterized protein n=1 Tax=Candidatus Brevundimonas colombiensis TaxID=3121376 RepID=A0AAJ5X0F4_9CAUL|nr:hypothetical protein [Brevundimonas sp.]WEK38927.1 MAG: hypothetical protein P0Y50_10235 [Brevundimonas sp.]
MALIGGVVGFGFLWPGEGETPDAMRRLGPFSLAALGLLVTGLEAVIFTVVPIELTRRLLKNSWIGVAVGGGGYVVGVHWDNGWLGLATSGWIWSVVTTAYLLDRPASFFRACLQAIGLKWVFWIFAFSSLIAAS